MQQLFSPDEVVGFADLKDRLAGLENQTIGVAGAVCETGEEYVQFQEYALSRPDDVAVIERIVARRMARRLLDYLGARGGRIYWRIPFEAEISPYAVVIRFDENGADTDAVSDRRCVLDRNWRRVASYCRVYRATHRALLSGPETKALAA